jgi:hypothetical protein
MQVDHAASPLRFLPFKHHFAFEETQLRAPGEPLRRNMQNETTGQVASGEAARVASVIS